MHTTPPLLIATNFPPLRRARLETLQVNLGCCRDQQCVHCHVTAGPRREEAMDDETLEQVIAFLRVSGIGTLDIAGGAPELHPRFCDLVAAGRELGLRVIDRCNPTVLEEPGQESTAEFLAWQEVEIIASLPCYLQENVDRQCGKGVFEASIRVLRRLNALGYGQDGSGLTLNLVYNPQDPVLPPAQDVLEADYRRELNARHGIVFNRLLVLANMPIQRFGSTLVSKGCFQEYVDLLRRAHRDENLAHVMCRTLISVDWQGWVYDCGFNQMLGLPLRLNARSGVHLTDLMDVDLEGRPIMVADHCYGCTAGQGSSCGGALTLT